MINDLVLPTYDYWKYIDDLTASEVIAKYGSSTIQSDLDYISSWSSANSMKLNFAALRLLPQKALGTRLLISLNRSAQFQAASRVAGVNRFER
jgi:hypothetical protein